MKKTEAHVKKTFKKWLGQYWWILILPFVLAYSREKSVAEIAYGVVIQALFFLGVLYAYWFFKYGRRV